MLRPYFSYSPILNQTYTSASSLFSLAHKFDQTSRKGPKVWWCISLWPMSLFIDAYSWTVIWFHTFQAFVSEYAVTGKDAGTGSLLAALAEAGFLIGLEKNRCVDMPKYTWVWFFSSRLYSYFFWVKKCTRKGYFVTWVSQVLKSLSCCFYLKSNHHSKRHF